MEVYVDGASIEQMREVIQGNKDYRFPCSGFTTNPSLVRKLGVQSYVGYLKEACETAGTLPVSVEVLSDDLDSMINEGLVLAENLSGEPWIKIPVMTTERVSTAPVIQALLNRGHRVNVTAVLTHEQIEPLLAFDCDRLIVSVFAGRIADTMRDPTRCVSYAASRLKIARVLWASTREIRNWTTAKNSGADIITMTHDMFTKMNTLFAKDLNEYSADTVQMFRNDALKAGYTIDG